MIEFEWKSRFCASSACSTVGCRPELISSDRLHNVMISWRVCSRVKRDCVPRVEDRPDPALLRSDLGEAHTDVQFGKRFASASQIGVSLQDLTA